MPLQSTSGAASYDAFGGGVAAVPKYIEEYFSTFLYSGTGAAQTITNGIDLATKGGLVWYKRRSGVGNNVVVDTSRGMTSGSSPLLNTNTTDSQTAINNYVIANTTGFSFGANATGTDANASGSTYVSWSWAKAPKFFDVVTWTGDGTGARTLSHNLGSVPGCIIVKRYEGDPQSWEVYHQSLGNTQGLHLDLTNAASTWSGYWNNTSPTATQFTVGSNKNAGGSPTSRYVAYIFAHNAGGFGLTGTDNVISCGLTTANGSGDFSVNLGYEPQWVLMKSTGSGIWSIVDNMRGATASSGYTSSQRLQPQSSAAEDTLNGGYGIGINATGFTGNLATFSNDFIYIAIRRGPMKVPTSGTSVFSPNTANTSAGTPVVTNFPVDLSISVAINGDTRYFSDRLRGVNSTGQTANQPWIASNSTGAELTNASIPRGWDNTQILVPPYYAGGPVVWWNMRRAPSFFDEVCYTGTGTAGQTYTHNLGVAPELIIVKSRSLAGEQWPVYASPITVLKVLQLNTTIAATTYSDYWNNTAPTSSVFSVGSTSAINQSAATYVAYLFATCAGVSKVGSYTGTGTTLQVDCGFTGGARFVLIKRTDSTGDWYVWDSARGIVAGNDPYLLLNSTAAEVTSTDYVDTYSAGFEISSTAPAAINASGGTFIFLAIA